MYHPHNQYQSLLRTENIEPLVRTIEQLNTEVENNEAGLVELCRMLDNDFHFPTNVTTMNKTNSKEDLDDGDGALFYLIEQNTTYRDQWTTREKVGCKTCVTRLIT